MISRSEGEGDGEAGYSILENRVSWFPEMPMTNPDQLRAIVEVLQDRVKLVTEDDRAIAFEPPTTEDAVDAGFDEPTFSRLTSAPWWQEMIDDIIETPEFAEPDASPTVVLGYARDVIREYIGKRFEIDS